MESNPDAVRDAVGNAKANDVKNIRFYERMQGIFCRVVQLTTCRSMLFSMDPPRAEAVKNFWMRLKSVQSASYMYPAIRRRWSATVPIWKNRATVQRSMAGGHVPMVGAVEAVSCWKKTKKRDT
ncbi:MAG: hypothetical protein ACLURV_01420 [Gallintestinimicrobium sp.]